MWTSECLHNSSFSAHSQVTSSAAWMAFPSSIVVGEVLTDASYAQGLWTNFPLSPILLSIWSSLKGLKHHPYPQSGHSHICHPWWKTWHFLPLSKGGPFHYSSVRNRLKQATTVLGSLSPSPRDDNIFSQRIYEPHNSCPALRVEGVMTHNTGYWCSLKFSMHVDLPSS